MKGVSLGYALAYPANITVSLKAFYGHSLITEENSFIALAAGIKCAGYARSCHTQALLANIRLGCRGLPWSDALAYLASEDKNV
jgi:hypothetical protein